MDKEKKEQEQEKLIVVDYISVTGIKNSLITVMGKKRFEDIKFEIYANNKKMEYKNQYADTELYFSLTSVLGKNLHLVEIYAIYKDRKELVAKIHTSFILRMIKKFMEPFYSVCRKIRKKLHFRTKKFVYDSFDKYEYNDWIKYEEPAPKYEKLNYNPLISILIPVYNVEPKYLKKCLDSILKQHYENFEVCLVDDASTKQETIDTLKEYEKLDSRIRVKYNKKNQNISLATNDALKMAKGEFIALTDDDDELTPNALYENVKVLNENGKLDFIYSDEDKLDLDGKRCEPNFKTDWAPDTLLSCNYLCHLVVIRKKLVDEVGGEEAGLEGAQDYDLFLKVTEKTKNIYHIPKILYHWRKIPGSTSMKLESKNYAIERSIKAIDNALKRRKILGHAEFDEKSMYYRVVYELKEEPLVSILIPTKDYADITENCLKSIYEKTTYKNFEVILIDNRSEKQETFDLFEKYKKEHKNFKVVKADMEFNYSKINNLGASKAKGEYICLLNNDTEIITPDWLQTMVGYASQKHIGAVGAKLLYPGMTVQHCGVIVGLGGVASHVYCNAAREDTGRFGCLRVPNNYSAVTAACLVVKKSRFEAVGKLETDLQVAYNDVDFCLKLLRKGYYNVELPQVELLHYESKSRGLDTTSEKYKRFVKEQEYMYNKWRDYISNDPFYNTNFSKRNTFFLQKIK